MNQTESIEWEVDGMSCVNCALSIEKYLKNEGNTDVKVDFASKSVAFKPQQNTDLNNYKKGIENLGFEVLSTEKAPSKWTQDKVLLLKLIVCVIFTLPLFFSMFLPFEWLKNPLVQLLLCLPVALIGFTHFGKKAFFSLKSGILNMDVLILLGGGAAFVYSVLGY